MMKSSPTAALSTVALWVSLAAAVASAVITDASWWAYTHVHVVNEFSDGRMLTVHCKSRDDNMGTHWVAPHSEYEWRFRPSIFGNTLFWCHVWKGDAQIIYDAYYADDDQLYDRVYMDNSFWVAKDDGLYLRQFWKGRDVFWRSWP